MGVAGPSFVFLGVDWRSVHQPSPLRSPDRPLRSLPVADLAPIVAEVELVEVAPEVLAADVVEGPIDSALEQREVALHGLRVRLAAHVLIRGVVHALVAGELAAHAPVWVVV